MDDDESKVIRAVAALEQRDEEASAGAMARESGLSVSMATGVAEKLFRGGLLWQKPVTYFVDGDGGQPHVKAYTVSEKGIKALKQSDA